MQTPPEAHADACVDPDVFFADASTARRGDPRRSEQLRAAIRRALVRALECDVHDPRLDGLTLVDVIADPGGTWSALFASTRLDDLDDLEQRLRDAAPVFKRALAGALARKRVPQVAFYVVPATTPAMEVDDEP